MTTTDKGAQGKAARDAQVQCDEQRGGVCWLVPDWPAPAHVRAAATLRPGGVSQAPYAGLNLADHVGDDPAAVTANRRQLARVLASPQPLDAAGVWLEQVHSAQVVRAGVQGAHAAQADAVYAATPGSVCAVLTADCLPLLMCDTAGTVVAAAHAGWRGLAAGIIEQTLSALAHPVEDLLVWLGPAIGPDAFEVGAEVYETFMAHDARASRAFRPSPFNRDGTHWLADIYSLARQRLSACGVERVYGGHWCTYNEPGRFYSYRRDGVTGRMASVIWLGEG